MEFGSMINTQNDTPSPSGGGGGGMGFGSMIGTTDAMSEIEGLPNMAGKMKPTILAVESTIMENPNPAPQRNNESLSPVRQVSANEFTKDILMEEVKYKEKLK